MRCKNCGKRFALYSHGMGFSDPPGCFFVILVSCLVAGSLATFFAIRGSVIGIVVAVFCGLTAFYATGGVITGMWDQRVYDGPKCPHCNHKVKRIWPWSM